MILGVRGKILATSISAVVLGIGVAAVLSGKAFEEEYAKSLRSEVSVIANNLRSQLDRIRSLGLQVKDIRGFEEQCKDVLREHPDLGYAMVARSSGLVLFHNNPAYQGKTLARLAWLGLAPGNRESIHLAKDDNGEEFYSVAIPSGADEGGRIFVVVGFPSRLVSDKVNQLVLKSALFASIALIAAIILLLVLISTSVTHPLSRLVSTIREIRTSGNLNKKVVVRSRDELCVLATSFNEMIDSLRQAYERLEERVAERTKELSVVNEDLRQEINERTRVERALRESEERYRLIAERTGQMIYDYDVASGRIRWVGAITEVSGYTPEEFANVHIKEWGEMIHPEDRPEVNEALEQALRHGASFHMPYRFRRKDGSYFHVEDSAVILRTPQGESYRMLGTMKDITLRKEAEDQLKRSHELLEQRVQERTLELVRANEQIRQAQADLVQAEKMSMLGQLVAGVAHEINTPTGAIMNVASEAASHLRELAVVAAGELSKVDEDLRQWLTEQIPQILSHNTAFTEAADRQARRKLEAELKEHGVKEYRRAAAVLKDCGLNGSDPQAVRCVSQVAGLSFLEHLVALRIGSEISLVSVQKIAKIVKALRYYSRSGEGELFDINLSESIDNTLVILQNRIKHLAKVERHYAQDLPPVRCGGDISQVWTNLLSNACDAIEDFSKGEGLIRITTFQKNRQAVIQLFNVGPPIPQDTMSRIFDPFFTTKPIGKGTGLGLSICAGIMRKYHGSITARNEENGVTFEITLPLRPEDAEEEQAAPSAGELAHQTS